MPRYILAVYSIFCVAPFGGCSGYSEFQQKVFVEVLGEGGAAVAELEVRYYSESDCKGPFKTAVTTGSGEASLAREAKRGTIAVLLEAPSLCFQRNGTWYSAWREVIDPADVERFSCTMRSSGLAECVRKDQVIGI